MLFRSLLHPIERAELAIDIADVGVIHVAIHVVGDELVAASAVGIFLRKLAAMVGERAEFFERQGVKAFGLRAVNALAVPDFLQQVVE